MLNLSYVPTNAQLFSEKNQIKRPRFYALRRDTNVRMAGYIEPREIDGRLRWAVVNQDTGEITAVPLQELRNARMYVDKTRKGETRAIYLFVYVERGGEKRYYVVPQQHVGSWVNQPLRNDMLSEAPAASISSARHIIPLPHDVPQF